MEKFNKVKNFDRFPLLKINGIMFYGSLDSDEAFKFICMHVRHDLDGCSDHVIVKNKGHSKIFTYIVISVVFLLVAVLAVQCRRRLVLRYENELNY